MMSFQFQNAPGLISMPPTRDSTREDHGAHGDDETLGEYGDRMRDKFSPDVALALLSALAPTRTYERNTSQ